MARISSLLICFTFGSTLLLGQSDIPITSMKMDSLFMKSGHDFKGLVLDENIKVLVFKSVEKKSGGQLKISTFTVDRKDIENVVKISPKDRALLETKLKEMANGNPNGNAPIDKPAVVNLPNEDFDVTLYPQGILLEPTRIREVINPKTKKKDVFFISPNTNRLHISPATENQHLALRKGLFIEGNEQTGNVTDAVYYGGEIITSSDTGHITTWQKNGLPKLDRSVIGKPISLIVPLSTDLLAIDMDWNMHLVAGIEKVSLTTYALPLLSLLETKRLIVARHGKNNLTAWDKTGRKLFSQEIGDRFDYLVAPDDSFLLTVTETSLKIFNLQKNTVREIVIDRGSYCTFVTVSVRNSILDSEGIPEKALLFQTNNARKYLLLDSGNVVFNEIKTFMRNGVLSLAAEVALIKENAVYPGIRKINDKVPDAKKQMFNLVGSSENKVVTLTRTAELKDSIDRSVDAFIQTFDRPLAQWNHFHTDGLPPTTKLDFEQPYKYTSIPGEINPATSTIFLDNKVAFASSDKYFHLLGNFRGNFKVERGEYFHIGNVCLNNSGTRMAHSAFNNSIWVWDTEKKKKLHTLDGGSPAVTLALSGDGHSFLSCHQNGKVIDWDMETGKLKSEWYAPGKPIKAQLNYNGTKVFLHCDGNRGFVLPTSLDKPLVFPQSPGEISYIQTAEKNFAMAIPAYTWNPTWKPKFLDHDPKTRKKNEAAFDPDGNKKDQYGVKDNQDQFISMSQDGKRAITLLNEYTVACWDLEKPKKLFELRHEDPVSCLKISNNGKWIITGNENYQAALFDGNTGAKIKTLGEHYGPIFSVGFFKNEKYAVLGCKFGVLFWDIEKGIISHTLLNLGGILFFDSKGNYDCDKRAEDFIAFRDLKTKELITSWKFNLAGIERNVFQRIIHIKRSPGMLKQFLDAEDVEVLQNQKQSVLK